MNEEIYMMVCRLYFKCDMDMETIVATMGAQLLKYQHATHEKPRTFRNMLECVRTIIKCEEMAHVQAKKLETTIDNTVLSELEYQ